MLGLDRYHRYRFNSLEPELLENVRFQMIRKPVILEILDYEEHMEGCEWYGRTTKDKREAQKFVQEWDKHVAEMRERRKQRV